MPCLLRWREEQGKVACRRMEDLQHLFLLTVIQAPFMHHCSLISCFSQGRGSASNVAEMFLVITLVCGV
jgi:hypothetical protein